MTACGTRDGAALAQPVGEALTRAQGHADTEDAAEIRAITDAMVRLLIGAPLHSDGKQTRAAKQQQDLARVRAERNDLRGQAQLLARIVHVLEIENSKLKETYASLEQQVAAQSSVLDLTRRRLRP
ncbi:hypothetical protein ACH419_31170 [Streptomyces bobili]|uniref:hypothetical protein n=1 Tax=Streptomyces bobili TaxID=67280 RepID=UPI00379D7CAD